jgi:hypothetical protein
VDILTDAQVGTAPVGLQPAFRIVPKINGTGGGGAFTYDDDGAGDWVWNLGGVAELKPDGLHSNAAKLDAAENTGLTLAENLYLQDGAEFVLIQSADGLIQTTGLVQGDVFRADTNTVITPAASIAIDCLNSGVFDVTADQNITIGAPSNFSDAQVIRIRWKQNGTGSWTPTWNSVYRFGSISNAPTATAGKVTIWTFLRNDVDSKWDAISVVTNL